MKTTSPDLPPTPESPGAIIPGLFFVLTLFVIGFANFPLQAVGYRFDHLPGDAIDNRLNNFVLEHGYRYLTGRAESFWDAPCFYPARRVTAWSDAHIGMLPVYAAFRATGLSPERAFQGWFLVPFVLNFVAAAWAARRLGFGPVAAGVTGYLFAFGLPVASQMLHAQLFPRFLVPVAVVVAWEGLQSPRTWRLAVVAACGVVQTYISVYLGYFLALLLATGLLVAVVRLRLPWREYRRAWGARLLVLAAAVGAVVPLAAKHVGHVVKAPVEDVRDFAPVPASWVTPPLGIALGWSPMPAGQFHTPELHLGMGFLPVAALGVSALLLALPLRPHDRRAAVLVGAGAALLLAVLVTRFGNVWLYEPVASSPGTGGIRVVGRIVLVLLFPAGLALGAGIEYLSRKAGKLRLAAALVFVTPVLIEQRLADADGPRAADWQQARCPLAPRLERQALIADMVRRHPSPSVVYAFPSAGEGPLGAVSLQVEVMRATQDLGLPCVNGWSGYQPHGWDRFTDARGVTTWLTVTNRASPDGLVLLGEP